MMMMMITMSFAMSGYKNFVQDQLSILECFLLFGFECSEPKKGTLAAGVWLSPKGKHQFPSVHRS